MDFIEKKRRLVLLKYRSPVPGKLDLLRQPLAAWRRLDLELKAHSALQPCRQAGNDANYVDVTALELRRQPVAHAQMRKRGRPQKPGRACPNGSESSI